MLADFAPPFDSLYLLKRDAPDGQPGQVYTAQTVQDIVGDGGAEFDWAQLVQMHNINGTGENVAQYSQEVNDGAGARVWGQVVEARNRDATDTSVQVVQELDAEGHTAVGSDVIAFGQLDSGLRILPAQGGHITTALAVNADTAVLDTNPADHFIYLAPAQNAGIALVGGHFVAVTQGHATLLA